MTAADRQRALATVLNAPFVQQDLRLNYTTYLLKADVPGQQRVLEGRAPKRTDHEGRRNVAWVNETFVKRFVEGDALGDAVRVGADTSWVEIAGVVNDVRTFGLAEDIRPMMYLPPTTTVRGTTHDVMQVTLRHSGDEGALATAIRGVIMRIDPNVAVTTIQTMEQVVRRSMARMSFTLILFGLAAATALLLGLVGLYGAIAYVVAQRTREIGVRIALGADAVLVRRMILRQGLTVLAAGIGAGLLVAVALTRLMGALLFETAATDPVTFVSVPLLLLAVGTIATWLPARRASRVSPLEALRSE
jgi:predicted lysophospholipase L1 biosynthesis ABC-type transport system permease subunit